MREVKCYTCARMVPTGSVDGYGECEACADARLGAQRAKSGLTSDYGPEAEAALDRACAEFSEPFGLSEFPGERFRANRSASFVSMGEIQIVVDMAISGEWVTFSRDRPERIRAHRTK